MWDDWGGGEEGATPPTVCLFLGDPILGILSPSESMTSWSSHLGIYKSGIERMQKVVGILKGIGEAHRRGSRTTDTQGRLTLWLIGWVAWFRPRAGWWWFSRSVVSDSCDPMDCSPPGSTVHGISQTRIGEWVAMSFSRGSPQPRDQIHVSLCPLYHRQLLYH